MAIRYGIFIFWAGCEDYLVTGRPVIDGNEIDLSILYEKSGNGSSEGSLGLVGLLYSLAESKVFGSIQETDNQNLYDVMAKLYQDTKRLKEMPK